MPARSSNPSIKTRVVADPPREPQRSRYRSLNDPESLREFARNLGEGIYITTPEGRILDANPAFLEMFGVESLEVLSRLSAFDLFLDPSQRELELRLLEREGRVREFEFQIRRPDGGVRWVLDTSYIVTDAATGERYCHGVLVDITGRKQLESELIEMSTHDAPTGALNRRYLDKRLIEEIQRSKRHRFPMSLMMLDIDAFKSYNDTFGHQAGDRALKIVANVLQDILRGADVAARYGGEEFAILLPQTTSSEAAAIAERLRQRVEHTEFPKRKITVSIGIAACSTDVDTPSDIIGAADHALYEAKNHGRNNVQVYDGFGKSFNDKIN